MKYMVFRIRYLRKLFRTQKDHIYAQMSKSKDKKDKQIVANIDKIQPTLLNKFLRLWLEKCKTRHSLAFLQFRGQLP